MGFKEKKALHYLDRLRLRCNWDEVMRGFKLDRVDGGSVMGFNLDCCKIKEGKGDHSQSETAWTSMGSRETIYLDRQNVAVSDNGPDYKTAIRGSKMNSKFNPDQLNYTIWTTRILN